MSTRQKSDATDPPFALTRFEPRHLPGALQLSREVAWPYRAEDWQFALDTGEGLVFARGDEIIGTAMWWRYGQSFATLGMIIVTPALQGGGHGSRLLDGLLAATSGRNLLLNATPEGMALYERRGFVALGSVIQHRGPLRIAVTPESHDDIRPANAADLAAITAIDAQAAGMDRAPLVEALAKVGDMRVIDRGGRIAGYAITRRFGLGYVVGPVIAGNAEDARRLILSHLSALHGHVVRIDIHAEDGLGDWLTQLGLAPHSRVTSMVRGQRPVREGGMRVYALANQSMG